MIADVPEELWSTTNDRLGYKVGKKELYSSYFKGHHADLWQYVE